VTGFAGVQGVVCVQKSPDATDAGRKLYGEAFWNYIWGTGVCPGFASSNECKLARRVETLYFFVCKNFFCRNLGLAREGDG
jgi:hypothetical protein